MDTTKHAMRAACCATLLLAASASWLRVADAAERHPLEGRWWGEIGSPKERIPVGLEFVRGDDGALVLHLTQPILNTFGSRVDGALKIDGDTVSHDALFLTLTRDGDTLTGTFPGPNSPATLKRAAKLPREQDPPRLPEGPAARWQTRVNGQVWASPIAHDGVVYVGSTGGVFNAIDGDDGTFVWTFAAGAPIYGSAAVADDAVYFANDDGWLFKLARADGKEIWRYELGDARVPRVIGHPQVFEWQWQAARPLLADGVVYLGARDGGFHAVDAVSGARRWRFDSRGPIDTGAAISGAHVVFGSSDHHVYALERDSGREAWRHDTGAHVDTAPVLHDGRILVGNRGAGLYSLDAATGELGWRLYFWGSWVESTPVVVDGTIYIGASDLRRVSAIDPANGHVRWHSDVYGWTFGTPLVIGDRIHVGAAGGTPYVFRHQASYSVLDRRSGKLLSRRPLPDPGGHQWGIAGSLARAGDTVVFATISGSVFGYPLE